MKLDPLHEALIKLENLRTQLANYKDGQHYQVNGSGMVNLSTMAGEVAELIRTHECELREEETAKRKITINAPEF